MKLNTILHGDALEQLRTLPDSSIQCVVTSPPYYGLRDYGVEGQIGQESTIDEYVNKLVSVFQDVKRVLKDNGTLWLNLGDSYASSGVPGTGYESLRRMDYGLRTCSEYLGALHSLYNPMAGFYVVTLFGTSRMLCQKA